jgi:LysM repeat protein
MNKYLMSFLGVTALVLSAAFTPLSASLQNALAASSASIQATAATSTDPTISYTVQPGDTLSALAQTYNTTVAAIMALNPQISDSSLIYSGQVILIPENSATTPVIPVTGSGTISYTVQAGDNLSTLAQDYGTTVAAIVALNPQITNPRLIYSGEVILIPVNSATTPVIPVTGSGTISYTVQPGDTLSALAQTYNTTVTAIQALNPQITDPSLIYSGQVILIPENSATTPVIPVTGSGSFTYIVQPGDNLSTLAQEYGTTVAAILALNPQISNPALIYSGEAISIP